MPKATSKTKSTGAAKASSVVKGGKKPAPKFGGSWARFAAVVPRKRSKSAGGKKKVVFVSPPRTDEQIGSLPGLMTEAELSEKTARLSATDRATLNRIGKLLAEHLGSHAAARAWLTAPGTGFTGTALDEVLAGNADGVLKLLMAQWSRNSPYA